MIVGVLNHMVGCKCEAILRENDSRCSAHDAGM